jgi:hypothetical protein
MAGISIWFTKLRMEARDPEARESFLALSFGMIV